MRWPFQTFSNGFKPYLSHLWFWASCEQLFWLASKDLLSFWRNNRARSRTPSLLLYSQGSDTRAWKEKKAKISSWRNLIIQDCWLSFPCRIITLLMLAWIQWSYLVCAEVDFIKSNNMSELPENVFKIHKFKYFEKMALTDELQVAKF